MKRHILIVVLLASVGMLLAASSSNAAYKCGDNLYHGTSGLSSTYTLDYLNCGSTTVRRRANVRLGADGPCKTIRPGASVRLFYLISGKGGTSIVGSKAC